MTFDKPRRAVDRVFLHCSASDRSEHDDIAVIRRWHVEDRGWSDVRYHFFIRKDGRLQAGRALARDPAAQKGHNGGTVAICLHGLAADRFTEAQYGSLIALCQCIDQAYGGMVSFHGHCEVTNKACPVLPYKRVLGLGAHGGMDFAPSVTPAVPRPGHTARPILKLTASGPGVAQFQHMLGKQNFDITEDGCFGQITLAAVRAFQRNQGMVADGIVGPRTWAALAS